MIATERLLLRRWKPEDLEPFAAMNADPEVMQHFPSTLTREQTAAGIKRVEAHFERYGWGLLAAEHEGAFIGYVGLFHVPFESHFTPAVEIGWRLKRSHWNRGLATEAARACLQFGFEKAGLQEIVSFTIPINLPSRRVMEKIGMQHDAQGDFEHPKVPAGHPMRRHVLYRIKAR
ncbi:MAG TPA: GNAT family N-acetyltransferase [Bryobacteraceae bacterium]|jgi:ribosomal-protein-alanine N-acetyltransferase